jgi:hypothetical protein
MNDQTIQHLIQYEILGNPGEVATISGLRACQLEGFDRILANSIIFYRGHEMFVDRPVMCRVGDADTNRAIMGSIEPLSFNFSTLDGHLFTNGNIQTVVGDYTPSGIGVIDYETSRIRFANPEYRQCFITYAYVENLAVNNNI